MNEAAVDLARLQFAFTVIFHIVFPAFSIGLASYLAVLNGLNYFTGRPVYLHLFNYWKRIFAVGFGMGVVSGVVITYQFGTNWSAWADKTGSVVGPMIGYEVFMAFFLEAGFFGVMMFGRERVGPALHLFACAMVAFGTFMSAFWILSVNSWMQTPQGYAINDQGQFVVADWWAVIFNPSFPYRLAHMLLASYVTVAFAVGAVGALHLLRQKQAASPSVRTMFSMAMWMAVIVVPIQLFVGDQHGLDTLKHQPEKLAALEGHYETANPAGLVVFGIPNEQARRMDFKFEIPVIGSLILKHSLKGEIVGLNAFPANDQPPVGPPFFAFRIMVGIGLLMLGLGLWGAWARHKGMLFKSQWLHKAAIIMGPTGFIAVICGWIVTETGRQPWTVYHLLRTSQSVSPVAAEAVTFSLIGFVVLYLVIFSLGIFYIIRLMNIAPKDDQGEFDPFLASAQAQHNLFSKTPN